MQKKGQLFSLDFIISMVAVTAAIGLLLHSIEVNAYSQKEQQLHDELKQVAETAADLLVASDEPTCLIQGTDLHLINCINSNTGSGLVDKLFPSGYGYEIRSDTLKLNYDTRPPNKDFYDANRLVVTNAVPISKENFEEGIFTSGGAIPISIRVWKI